MPNLYDIVDRTSWIGEGVIPGSFEPSLKIVENLIIDYCRKHEIKLTGIGVTHESGKPEIRYHFSDDVGYVTLTGIKKDLSEKN